MPGIYIMSGFFMNKSLEETIKFSHRMLNLKIQRQRIKEIFDSETTFGYNGGIFKINDQLISYVYTLIEIGKISNVVTLDSNGTPILIENIQDFFDIISDRYFMALGKYQAGYTALKNQEKDLK